MAQKYRKGCVRVPYNVILKLSLLIFGRGSFVIIKVLMHLKYMEEIGYV